MAPGEAPVVHERGLSLRYKLPLLIVALLLALLAACVAVAYREVRAAAVTSASERLRNISDELAERSTTTTAARSQTMRRVAADPALRNAVLNGRADERAQTVLASLQLPNDSGLPIELWNARGEKVASVGTQQIWAPGEPQPVSSAPMNDTSMYHPLQTHQGRVFFWMTIPVLDGDSVVGRISQLRRAGGQGAEEQLAALFGKELRFFYADTRSKVAMSPGGHVIDWPGMPVGQVTEIQQRGARALGYMARVEGTPWSIGIQTPMAEVLERPERFLRRIALISAILLLIGSIVAWLLARTVTAPLAELTSTAGALANGKYDRRVAVRRSDELGTVGNAFNTMAEQVQGAIREAEDNRHRAQTANRAKSEFLAMMSHEIRTPINAMIGYADLLELGISGPVTEQQRSQIARIKGSGRHLVGLVDDVLDFAKIESGQLRVQGLTGSVAAAIETATSLVQPQAAARGVTLHAHPPAADLKYHGDPQRVEQILVNLISNAVKFTEPGGQVVVEAIRREPPPGKRATDTRGTIGIRVRDTGIGIAADQLKRIFEPFVQAESGYTRTRGGSGLGLTISRRLAQLMDGDISAESEPGKGSTFTLWLPAATAGHGA